MKPVVLFLGFSLFFLCLALHVLVWRIWHPQRHAIALFTVFLGPCVPFAALFMLFCSSLHFVDLLAIVLLHLALSCAYIQVYPALQAFSPTLVILLLVRKSMPLGVTQEELMSRLDTKFLMGERLQDLIHARLVRESDQNIELTPRGLALIYFFILFRRAFGLSMGKG